MWRLDGYVPLLRRIGHTTHSPRSCAAILEIAIQHHGPHPHRILRDHSHRHLLFRLRLHLLADPLDPLFPVRLVHLVSDPGVC